jgi:hypothetical protein
MSQQTTVRILVRRFRPFFLPAIVITIAIVLAAAFLLPLVQQVISMQDELRAKQERIRILSTNLDTLTALDANELDRFVLLARNALPEEKDYVGILDAISDASVVSSVSVGDYDIQVGDIRQSTGDQKTLQISLNISGNVTSIAAFTSNLQKRLPLADVIEVRMNNQTTANVVVQFFFAPIGRLSNDPGIALPVIGPRQREILTLLSDHSQTLR